MIEGGEFKQGELSSDIKSIKETLSRVEASLIRYGERTGEIETKQANQWTAIKVVETMGAAALEDIKDLKASRNWFIVAVIGGFITALWKLVTGVIK